MIGVTTAPTDVYKRQGSICSPILSSCIETFGWQMGYIIKAIILLCLCLPAVLYPFHVDARDDGYLPYCYEEKNENDVSVESPTFHFITVAFISFFEMCIRDR